jgi:hypothetical protein
MSPRGRWNYFADPVMTPAAGAARVSRARGTNFPTTWLRILAAGIPPELLQIVSL